MHKCKDEADKKEKIEYLALFLKKNAIPAYLHPRFKKNRTYRLNLVF